MYILVVVIYCYLERENDKAMKFHVNNSSYKYILATFEWLFF